MRVAGVRDWAIKIALLAGFIISALGVRKIGFPDYSPSLWNSVPSHIFFIVLFAASVATMSKLAKVHLAWAGCGVLIIVTTLGGAIGPLLGLVGIFAAFFTAGRMLLSVFAKENRNVSALSATVVGAAIYGTMISISAQFPINYLVLYAFFLIVPILLRHRDLLELFAQARNALVTKALRDNLVALFLLAMGIFYLAVAMMPEIGFDALAIHLFVPARLVHDHMWAFDPDKYVWAVMPMFADWLFSLAYMIAGETCTRMLNVAFIFVVCAFIRETVLWLGGDRKGANWAALLFLTMPLAFTESVSLFVDTVWTAFVLAGVLYAFRSLQKNERNRFDLSLAGLFLGAALASKAVTFMILPPVFIILLLGFRRISRLRDMLVGTVFFLLGLIPYVRAYLLSGNPVFPFYNNIFKSVYYPAVGFDPPPMFTKGVSWDVLYRITFESASYLESKNGAAGFTWLLFLIPTLILIATKQHRRALAVSFVAICAIFLTFHSTAYLRYVLPSFALLATVIGYGFSPLALIFPKYPRLIPGLAIIAVIMNVIFLNSSTYNGELNTDPLSGESERTAYLEQKASVRNVVETLNALNRDETPVGFFAQPLAAGLNTDAYYFNWYNFRFQQALNHAQTPAETAATLMANNVEYMILDSSWDTPSLRKKIEDASTSVWTRGSLSIRKLKDEYFFKTELMENPNFQSAGGWAPAAKPYPALSGALEITDDTPAFQVTKAEAKKRYRQTVVVQCEKPSTGRLQINWLDSQSKLIRSDSRAFDCANEQKTHTMDSVAPKSTDRVIVFAVATSNVPVTFRKVSFAR